MHGGTTATRQKTLATILPVIESDRIHKPSLYNKEFDRRTADVILGFNTCLKPNEWVRERSAIQLSAIKVCHHILIYLVSTCKMCFICNDIRMEG